MNIVEDQIDTNLISNCFRELFDHLKIQDPHNWLLTQEEIGHLVYSQGFEPTQHFMQKYLLNDQQEIGLLNFARRFTLY